jgi:hypothetical protein
MAVVTQLTPINWAAESIPTTSPTEMFAMSDDIPPIGELTSISAAAWATISGPDVSADLGMIDPVGPGHGERPDTGLNRAGGQTSRLAAATQPMRRFVQNLPKRSTLGWQRTILLLLGGALLAAGVTGGWRRDRQTHAVSSSQAPQRRQPAAGAQIHRMTRAPLRVDASTSKASAAAESQTAADKSSADPIFRMPAIGPRHGGQDRGTEVDRPVTPPTAHEPASEFPSMAAPDGSAVSRRGAPSNRRALPTETNRPESEAVAERFGGAADQLPRGVPDAQNSFSRETLAETLLIDRGETDVRSSARQTTPVNSYPHTHPESYRDPYYEVPAIAERGNDTSR